MYKLRKWKWQEKYNIGLYENIWICWYYFPQWDSVNILMWGQVISEDQYDEEWEYSWYITYYATDYIPELNWRPMHRIRKSRIKQMRVLKYFPRECVDEVRDTFPDNIYCWDWEVLSQDIIDNIDSDYLY